MSRMTRGDYLVRGIVALVAVVLTGWLAVSLRDAWLYQRAYASGAHLDVPGTAARAERDFRAARLLNPDRAPDIGRALVLSTTGSKAAALVVLDAVLQDEPD